MKNALIIHGTGTRNDEFWFPWMKKELEAKGYTVWLPQMPNADHPNLEEWLPFIMDQASLTEDTILIGHSAGAQLILSILERISKPIRQAILVSGYARALRASADDESDGAVNWKKVRGKYRSIIFINSDNDPWGCDDAQGKIMQENLGGELIVAEGEGHMGSTTYKQPYKEFPLLVKLLDA